MSSLDSLLTYAAAHVPKYRGLPPALTAFPVLDKRIAQADLGAHISDKFSAIRRALVEFMRDEKRPVGVNDEDAFDSRIMVEQTSGSSGIPFRTAKTQEERARLSFAIWKYRRGYDPLCSVKNFYPIFHRPAGVTTIGKARDFTAASVEDLYQKLSAAGMRWVHCSPDILRRQAELISPALAIGKSVRFAENTSRPLSEDDRRFIEERLHVTLVDQYGCREVWAMGHRCGTPDYQVLSENVVIELLDSNGAPIHAPEIQGRIVVTSLHQRMFPVIRFDTGDLGCWTAEGVGEKFRLSNHRRHNVLRLADREVDGNEFFRKLLGHAFRETGFMQIQYIQIRQVARDRFELITDAAANAAALCAALGKQVKLGHAFPGEVSFQWRPIEGDELERELLAKPALFTTKGQKGD